ncbi:hypothetical protein FE257_007266 [Aspergillus nanangensis]|uniref:Transaldolase n=1 Tax=Aspergillus nanangensis TaxID=2582783 RepID=A0AAD4GUC5_ASPNN|nr:hypothetical protein FE257_007266 [Aspergillus nanangensis]
MSSSSTVSTFEYLRSKTQVDIDSLDIKIAQKGALGTPFSDATSNQIEVFAQLSKPENASVIDDAKALASRVASQYPKLSLAELAVEAATVILAARILPHITGNVHVMCNPCYSYSTTKVLEAARRYHALFRHLKSDVDTARVVIKVPATWEGMQAARTLQSEGVKTLATTLFTMEQAILAGEVGCVSISPFIHELKTGVDPTYKDSDDLLHLCVDAQRYYECHGISTRVKACSAISIEEILQLAGVAAHTIEPYYVESILTTEWPVDRLTSVSLFKAEALPRTSGNTAPTSYINDEARYRVDFAGSQDGQGQLKLWQAISIFCDYQKKVEFLMGDRKM